MALPKAIFFDLDETLLADNRSFYASIERVCEELGGAFPDFALTDLFDLYRTHSDAYWAEVGDLVMNGTLNGQAVRLEVWRRALEACSCRDEALATAALASYSRHRSETYSLFEDAHALLEWLPARLPIAVITNGASETQWEKVRRLGLDSRSKAVLVSGEIGVAKPDPRSSVSLSTSSASRLNTPGTSATASRATSPEQGLLASQRSG